MKLCPTSDQFVFEQNWNKNLDKAIRKRMTGFLSAWIRWYDSAGFYNCALQTIKAQSHESW